MAVQETKQTTPMWQCKRRSTSHTAQGQHKRQHKRTAQRQHKRTATYDSTRTLKKKAKGQHQEMQNKNSKREAQGKHTHHMFSRVAHPLSCSHKKINAHFARKPAKTHAMLTLHTKDWNASQVARQSTAWQKKNMAKQAKAKEANGKGKPKSRASKVTRQTQMGNRQKQKQCQASAETWTWQGNEKKKQP